MTDQEENLILQEHTDAFKAMKEASKLEDEAKLKKTACRERLLKARLALSELYRF